MSGLEASYLSQQKDKFHKNAIFYETECRIRTNLLGGVMRRLTISIPKDVYEILEGWGDKEDRSVPNLISHLARKAAQQYQQEKEPEQQSMKAS